MRRAAKIDANQPEIIATLRARGWSVLPLHMVGKGCPDLLIGAYSMNWLVEIKNPDVRWVYTPEQAVWHEKWRGQLCTGENAEDIIQLIEERWAIMKESK